MKPEKVLARWMKRVPPDGAVSDQAVSVMEHLGMCPQQRASGHVTGFHPRLVGSDAFPQGVITVNCHAFGKQGVAHPAAIRDIVKAARIIEEDQTDE